MRLLVRIVVGVMLWKFWRDSMARQRRIRDGYEPGAEDISS